MRAEKTQSACRIVDFVLAFYVVHEIPDQKNFFNEIGSILKPGGKVLIVEPPVHVSKREFEGMIGTSGEAGLTLAGRPSVFLSKAVILEKGRQSILSP